MSADHASPHHQPSPQRGTGMLWCFHYVPEAIPRFFVGETDSNGANNSHPVHIETVLALFVNALEAHGLGRFVVECPDGERIEPS